MERNCKAMDVLLQMQTMSQPPCKQQHSESSRLQQLVQRHSLSGQMGRWSRP